MKNVSYFLQEKGRLAQQLGRIYGCNRKTENPLHIYLTGFDPDGYLFAECVRKNQGFLNYVVKTLLISI